MKKGTTNQRNIVILILLGAVVLLAKSAQLQLFDSSYQKKAEKITLEQQVLYPSRGLIFDRNEELLVYNKPLYELNVTYNKIDPNMDTSFFCKLLHIDKETFEKNTQKDWSNIKYHKSIPFTFLPKISPEIFLKFQEHLFRFPGFSTAVRSIRSYPHEHAAHILGYLGEVDQSMIDKKGSDYGMGDFIGKSGLEKFYEGDLKGEKGRKYLLRDNMGNEVSSYNEGDLDSSSVAGVDIYSGIDLSLQQYGEKLMQNKRGSIVAIEPSSGEILCMISAPSYDPNLLNLDENRSKTFKALLGDTLNRPFLDRSVLAKYPPGSIFKPVLTLIALQEGLWYPSKSLSCPGEYQYRTFTYGCHPHPRPNNIEQALMHSCNTYYFEMVRNVIEKDGFNKPESGMDMLSDYLQKFGLGTKLGLDNIYENRGFIPNSRFYDRLYRGNNWRSTYVMSIGIGQGELELTTVQMANLAAIIGNKGYYYTPHLVSGFSDGRVIDEKYRTKNYVGVDSSHFDRVIRGMRRTITSGTGMRGGVKGIEVCGKTGTSQNKGKDHSVFFAFAPQENPDIAIAVYVENAGFGGNIAASISSLMIEKYIKGEIPPTRDYLEQRMLEIDLLQKPSI